MHFNKLSGQKSIKYPEAQKLGFLTSFRGTTLKSSPLPLPFHLNPNISLVHQKGVEELLKSITLLWHKSTPCHPTGHLHLLHLTYPLDPEDGVNQFL
jgi:hypothetical protein